MRSDADIFPWPRAPAASAHTARDRAEDPRRGICHNFHGSAAEPPSGRRALAAAVAGHVPRALPGLDDEPVDLAAVAICVSPHRVVGAALPPLQHGQLEGDRLVVQHTLVRRDPGFVIGHVLLPRLDRFLGDPAGRADPHLQKSYVVQAFPALLLCSSWLAHATSGGAEDLGRGVRHYLRTRTAEPSGGRKLTAPVASRLPRGLPGRDRETIDLAAIAICISPHRVVGTTTRTYL